MKKYSNDAISKYDNNTYMGRLLHFSNLTNIK